MKIEFLRICAVGTNEQGYNGVTMGEHLIKFPENVSIPINRLELYRLLAQYVEAAAVELCNITNVEESNDKKNISQEDQEDSEDHQ